MAFPSLFPDMPVSPESDSPETIKGTPQSVRVVEPVRNQGKMVFETLDDRISPDHRVRSIWSYLSKLDLSPFYESIQVFRQGPGRPTTSPKILLALWIYATTEGIGSARRLHRMCESDDAFRWIAGGAPINYHMLADFRSESREAMDQLMSQILATLLSTGLVEISRVAQDGMKVRASVGADTYRREKTLLEWQAEAKEVLDRLSREDREYLTPSRKKAACLRAAREKLERIDAALLQLKELQKAKTTEETKSEVRVSTTDPMVPVMKMGDGGYRPAVNIQIASDTVTQVIFAVEPSLLGTDHHAASPIIEQIKKRTGEMPDEYLVDGGYSCAATVNTLTDQEIVVYAPLKRSKKAKLAPTEPHPKDSEQVAAFRERMGTEEAKTIYRERSRTAEWVNAQWRSRMGVQQMPVRGLERIESVVLLWAVTHNILRWMSLSD